MPELKRLFSAKTNDRGDTLFRGYCITSFLCVEIGVPNREGVVVYGEKMNMIEVMSDARVFFCGSG